MHRQFSKWPSARQVNTPTGANGVLAMFSVCFDKVMAPSLSTLSYSCRTEVVGMRCMQATIATTFLCVCVCVCVCVHHICHCSCENCESCDDRLEK